MTETRTDKPKFVTPEGRLMWAWLFKPRAPKKPGRDPQFMCDVIFGPDDLKSPEFLALKAAANAAATEKFGAKLPGLIAAEKFINPFWKNERKVDEAGNLLPGYTPGGIYITAKTNSRPGITKLTDAGMVPVMDENEIYPGCWVRISVDCYAFDNESKGISFGLSNVLKIRDGDPLGGGGRSKPEDDFAGIAPKAPAGGAPAAGTAASLF